MRHVILAVRMIQYDSTSVRVILLLCNSSIHISNKWHFGQCMAKRTVYFRSAGGDRSRTNNGRFIAGLLPQTDLYIPVKGAFDEPGVSSSFSFSSKKFPHFKSLNHEVAFMKSIALPVC